MLAVTRFRIPASESGAFLREARAALAVLSGRPGWRSGEIGRAVDDPELWAISTRWDNVGSYRRALSAHDVKMAAVPLLSRAIDEPTAFELLTESDETAHAADAGTVGVGEAAAPAIRTDLTR